MKKFSIKRLMCVSRARGGRNNRGRITTWHRGGRFNKLQRNLDFFFNFIGVVGKVIMIQGDWSNRTGFVMLVAYSNGYLAYMLATEGVKVGDLLMFSKSDKVYPGVKKNGSIFFCKNFKPGDVLHSIKEFGSRVKYIRAAGAYGSVLKVIRDKNIVVIKFPSGDIKRISGNAIAVRGKVSNMGHYLTKMYKAGQNRWRGRRPVVRGEAMNPVDHPHGGRTRGGRHPVTPWGRLTKGVKTRKKQKTIKNK